MEKSALRSLLKQNREKISEEKKAAYEKLILEELLESQEYQRAEVLLTYISFGSEFSTINLIEKANQDQKLVFCPRIYNNRQMEFFRVFNLENCEVNRYGILEPREDALPFSLKDSKWQKMNILMLVPGLGFTKSFHRIGYGGGFYDTYLSRVREIPFQNFFSLGIGFPQQVLEETLSEQLFLEEHDEALDKVICGKYFFGNFL